MQGKAMQGKAMPSGGGGIRTLGRVAPTPVFKTGAIGRSATPPGNFRSVHLSGRLGSSEFGIANSELPDAEKPRGSGRHAWQPILTSHSAAFAGIARPLRFFIPPTPPYAKLILDAPT